MPAHSLRLEERSQPGPQVLTMVAVEIRTERLKSRSVFLCLDRFFLIYKKNGLPICFLKIRDLFF